MAAPNRNRVSSVKRALEIVEYVWERDGAGLIEIADHFDLAKSTAHRHLTTLEDEGYLVSDDKEYTLSFKFLALGEYVRTSDRLYELAKPVVEKMAMETEERAQFTVEDSGYLVYVHTAMGDHAVKTDSGVGKHVPMNTVSAGKAILAHLPDDVVREIIDRRGLPKRTENTITDERTLVEEMDTIRDRGYALNYEESTPGLRAISVPVMDENGTVIGAFGLSGPTHRFSEERLETELVPYLLGIANEFELEIKYQ